MHCTSILPRSSCLLSALFLLQNFLFSAQILYFIHLLQLLLSVDLPSHLFPSSTTLKCKFHEDSCKMWVGTGEENCPVIQPSGICFDMLHSQPWASFFQPDILYWFPLSPLMKATASLEFRTVASPQQVLNKYLISE